ncbi:MAG: acyl carrier protein [Candidatus Korobacteraceae bacterium]
MDKIKQDIRQFVSELVPNGSAAKLRDDTPLRTSGVLDSMGLLRLVSMVEEKFGIEVSAYEAGIENFDRIDDIAAFVERKRLAKA